MLLLSFDFHKFYTSIHPLMLLRDFAPAKKKSANGKVIKTSPEFAVS